MNSKLEKLTAVITPVDHKVVKVSFSGEDILSGFAETYADAINSKISMRGGSKSYDSVEFQRYFDYILESRIDKVNGKRITGRAKDLLIPALFATAINHIGEVFDAELGIALEPEFVTDKSFKKMTEVEAIKFSRELTLVEDLGFEVVPGIPFDRKGDIGFMYMSLASDGSMVKHDAKTHPGVVALTAFFKMEQLGNLLSFRVSYGLKSEYDEMLKGLIYDEAR